MIPASADVLAKARACILIEEEALRATAKMLDESFVDTVHAVQQTVAAGRKIIFSGVGKSAHVVQKLVGTFNSIGFPACFLDPTHALHGDLGLCAEGDLCLALSNSGRTEELIRLLPLLKRFGLRTVVITSNPDSELARAGDLHLFYQVPREACPLKLTPTASTTAALALGDALAMVLLELRGLTREDFARFHPAGNIGMILLLRTPDIMRSGSRFPRAPETYSVQQAILAMTKAKAGCIALIDEAGRLSGIFTDGDFRRSALSGPDFLSRPVGDFMTRTPRVISHRSLAVDALKLFEEYKIEDLIVIDDDRLPVGIIDVQDLPKLKIL